MRPKPECFACFLKQALIASRLAGTNEERQNAVQRRVLRLLQSADWKENPPHIATRVFRSVYRALRCADPYLGVKKQYNRRVKAMYPALEKRLARSRDRLGTAVRFALAGNIIDFGILEEFDLEKTVAATLELPLPGDAIRGIRDRIRKAGTILYLADNAGEIGFDRFLIAEMRRINPSAAISLLVKRSPIINDATGSDARYFGLERLARLIDTGGSRVGTHPRRASAAFRKIFAGADLIISKGQANFESLEDLRDPRIVFLLKAKCGVVARALKVPLNEAVISIS